MDIKIYKVDAFTYNASGGNPAGVVICEKELSEEKMLEIAREIDFSETAFIVPIDDENYKIRFFTPVCEVDLCGHATIGSFYTLAKLGFIKPSYNNKKIVYQETKIGKLVVELYYNERDIEKVLMEQGTPEEIGIVKEIDILSDIMGINISDVGIENYDLFPEIISTGLKDIILPIKSKYILDNLIIKKNELSKLSQDINVIGVHAFYYDEILNVAYTRNFAPLVGIDEESATGTSNGALIYYLKKHNILKGNKLISYQGETMNKLSQIHSMIEEEKDTIIIKVGGKAKIRTK